MAIVLAGNYVDRNGVWSFVKDIAVVMLVHSRPEHAARVLGAVREYCPKGFMYLRMDRGKIARKMLISASKPGPCSQTWIGLVTCSRDSVR